ncbi:MAG: S9 family peptidase [Clostridia bacterium]|nr:S9 family peptidase [Clostridia bacterium]MCL6521573.1 S9 family peptidase [Bacillota bacterium]
MTLRALEAEDLFRLRFLGEPELSPDGSRLLCVETTIDPKRNGYRSRLVAFDPERGGPPRPWTNPPEGRSDRHPRYSPGGGQVGFLSDRSGSNQLWLMPADGGEARQVTQVKGIADFAWVDERRLLLTVREGEEGPEPPEPEEEGPPPDEAAAQRKRYTRDVRVVDRIFYRIDSVGYIHRERSHLFLLDLSELPAGGEPAGPERLRRLTGPGGWDDEEARPSPDGRRVAFVSRRDEAHPDLTDLYVLSLEGGEPRRLTAGGGGVGEPAWSPDGERIAFLFARKNPDGSSGNAEAWWVPADGSGAAQPLSAGYDRSLVDASLGDTRGHDGGAPLVWSPDGSRLYALASDRGATRLVAVEVGGGRVETLTGEEPSLFGIAWPRDRSFFVALGTEALAPCDLWRGRPGEGGLRRLSRINGELLDGIDLGVPERFTFRARPGSPEIDGWLLRPAGNGPEAGVPAPVVLEVHGGPAMMYTGAFFFEFQLLRARGFAVLWSNPRGSEGYGEAFRNAIHGRWGTDDFEDVMALLDAGLARGGLDPERAGIAGGSYGGFMTNWAVGHSDRFRAAVTMRSVVNWESDFGTGDFGFLDDEMFGGALPWRDPEPYRRMSPLTYVEAIRTPLLILHSENDWRCPIEQAEQLYAALKKLGRTVLFVRYPGESHELSRSGKPWHRLDRLERIAGWFEQYLRPAGR